jgi:hypothetical protein
MGGSHSIIVRLLTVNYTQSMQPRIDETESVSTPDTPDQEHPSFQIELYNPNGFDVRNAAMVLRIGNAEYSSGVALASDVLTTVFTLTSQEFEGLSDGDPISFLYGPYETEPHLFFGTLQKSQLQDATLKLDPHFFMTKENAAQRLSEIAPSIDSSELRESLQFTISTLERSLEPEFWDDPIRLDPIAGKAVFNFEMDALRRLRDLVNSERFPLGDKALLWGIIHQIILADRGLAAFAIEDASGELASSEEQRAKNLLLQGDVAALEGEFMAAVEKYQAAWLLVTLAEILVVDPSPS